MISGSVAGASGPGASLAAFAAASHPLAVGAEGHWADTVVERTARCASALLAAGASPDAPARVFMVPGRIEVLGKHTDYAGGRSLLAAVERGFVLVSVSRDDPLVRVGHPGAHMVDLPFSSDLPAAAGWANYPATVVRRLASNFPGIGPGADIIFDSDLPLAAGMSSSSALIVGSFLCIAAASGLFDDPRFQAEVRDGDALASYLAAVESGQGFGGLAGHAGVGTHGGSEDHTAILRAEAGRLLQYGFIPAARERTVRMPDGYCFGIACSGIEAEKSGAMRDRYNRASALVRALRETWGRAGEGAGASLASALRSAPEAAELLRAAVRHDGDGEFPAADLLARLDHFIRESEEIIPAASTALVEGRLERFGELVDESQARAEALLGNQTPETCHLARSARELGAVAASAFGAGYGGSVWALVREDSSGDFLRKWREAYTRHFPEAAAYASFFTSGAGPSARRIA